MPPGFTLETIRAARYNPGSPVSVNRLLPKGGRSLERSSGRGLEGVRLAGLGDSVAPSKRPSPGGPSGSKQTRVRGQSWPPAKPDLVLGPCHSCTQGTQAGPGLGQCPPLCTLDPQQKAKERHSLAKSIYKHATSLPRPHLSRKWARGQGWAGPGGKPPVPRLSV